MLTLKFEDGEIDMEVVRKATGQNDLELNASQNCFYDSGEFNYPFDMIDGVLTIKACEFCDCLLIEGFQCNGCWEVATRLLGFVRRPKGLDFAAYIVRGAMAERERAGV